MVRCVSACRLATASEGLGFDAKSVMQICARVCVAWPIPCWRSHRTPRCRPRPHLQRDPHHASTCAPATSPFVWPAQPQCRPRPPARHASPPATCDPLAWNPMVPRDACIDASARRCVATRRSSTPWLSQACPPLRLVNSRRAFRHHTHTRAHAHTGNSHLVATLASHTHRPHLAHCAIIATPAQSRNLRSSASFGTHGVCTRARLARGD
jgi:hypothetical protein